MNSLLEVIPKPAFVARRSGFVDWQGAKNDTHLVGLYQTYVGQDCGEHFAELIQALAICAGACSADRVQTLRQRLVSADNGLVATTLSQSLYKFEALLQDKQEHGQWVFETIARDWGRMLFGGATSFWETLNAGWDFDNAASLCHGWSAIPVYFYQAYQLGIKPLEPAFKTFEVDPVKSLIGNASGQVPTPFGPIALAITKTGAKTVYELSHPL